MTDKIYNVLFLCTGNSARSIMAESILNELGRGHFRAFSAGSQPTGRVNPLALTTLEAAGYPTAGFRSKSLDEFGLSTAPVMDFIFTVCDRAAGEGCPIWAGHTMTAHWGIADPAAAQGSEAERKAAFSRAFDLLKDRIAAFVSLPLATIDELTLSSQLREIGEREGASQPAQGQAGPYHDVILYHNPECGTSRNVLGLIRNAGIEPHIIEYLKTRPSRALLAQLIRRMGIPVRALLREKGTPYRDIGLDNPALTDEQLMDAMMLHPILINRPIVVTERGVRLCRPSETVLDLLPEPQRGEFRKEDGELVVRTDGSRAAG
jgi:arsenate reductase (glutaredoxin)